MAKGCLLQIDPFFRLSPSSESCLWEERERRWPVGVEQNELAVGKEGHRTWVISLFKLNGGGGRVD